MLGLVVRAAELTGAEHGSGLGLEPPLHPIMMHIMLRVLCFNVPGEVSRMRQPLITEQAVLQGSLFDKSSHILPALCASMLYHL